MKYIYLILALILSSLSFSENNVVEVKLGVSPSPRFDVTPSSKAKASYEIGAEYRYELTNNVEIGGGISYQNHGKLKRFTDIEDTMVRVDVSDTKLYNSIPIYATVKYNFRNETEFTPYIKANLGYSINTSNKNKSTYETYNKSNGLLLDSGTLKEYKAKNGIYYSLGIGAEYKGFIGELSYQINTSKIDGLRYDGIRDSGRADNKRLTLGIGYQFKY